MNREELLAACPKIAEIRSDYASTVEADSFEHGGLIPREESLADFDAALDEVLAIINPSAAPEPKPESMRIEGAATVDSRMLCTFTGASAQAREIPDLYERLARGEGLPDPEFDWRFTGCVFWAPGFQHVSDACEQRRVVKISFGIKGIKGGEILLSEDCKVGSLRIEYGKAAVGLNFASGHGSARFTEDAACRSTARR